MNIYKRQKYFKRRIELIKNYKKQGCYTCWIDENDLSYEFFSFGYVDKEKQNFYIEYRLSQTEEIINIYRWGRKNTKCLGTATFVLGSEAPAKIIFEVIDNLIRGWRVFNDRK